ncbi:MAG TPA: hypothetical protein VFE45_07300 [Coriobacteriia bacterium]|nr:hypothetical protein [Coriobacteriia bacterium]
MTVNPRGMLELKRQLDAFAQQVIDEVAASRGDKSTETIAAELDAGLRRHGINLPESVLSEWASGVQQGADLRADLHLT